MLLHAVPLKAHEDLQLHISKLLVIHIHFLEFSFFFNLCKYYSLKLFPCKDLVIYLGSYRVTAFVLSKKHSRLRRWERPELIRVFLLHNPWY